MLDLNDHVLEYVDAYLHDLLSAEDARLLEKHCAGCKICQVGFGGSPSAICGPTNVAGGRGPGVANSSHPGRR